MVVIASTIPGCEFKTQDVSESLAIALLVNHTVGDTTGSQNTPSLATSRGPKLTRPTIDIGVSIEEWNIFLRRWEVFRAGSGIDEASAPSQISQCAGADLGDRLLKANPNITSEALSAILEAMRSLAVIPVAACVLRTELLQLHQKRDIPGICSKGKRESRDLCLRCKVRVWEERRLHRPRDPGCATKWPLRPRHPPRCTEDKRYPH